MLCTVQLPHARHNGVASRAAWMCAPSARRAGTWRKRSSNRWFLQIPLTPSATAMAAIRGACASVGKPSYGAVRIGPAGPQAAARAVQWSDAVSLRERRSPRVRSAARHGRQMLRPSPFSERHVAAALQPPRPDTSPPPCGPAGPDMARAGEAERRRGCAAGSPRRGCPRRRRAGRSIKISDFRLTARRCTASVFPVAAAAPQGCRFSVAPTLGSGSATVQP